MKTKEENKDRKMALPKNVRLFLSITLTVVLVVFGDPGLKSVSAR